MVRRCNNVEGIVYYTFGYAIVLLLACLLAAFLYDKGIFKKIGISYEEGVVFVVVMGASAIVHFFTAIICALVIAFKQLS